jgi:crooked neck
LHCACCEAAFKIFRTEFESEHGTEATRAAVARLMPKRVKRRRRIDNAGGDGDAGWEEYFDYIFPEDENAKPNLKLLAMAKMWKKQKESETGSDQPVKEEEPVHPASANPDAIDLDNLDADDDDIRNESSSGSEDEDDDEDEDSPGGKRQRREEGGDD